MKPTYKDHKINKSCNKNGLNIHIIQNLESEYDEICFADPYSQNYRDWNEHQKIRQFVP